MCSMCAYVCICAHAPARANMHVHAHVVTVRELFKVLS